MTNNLRGIFFYGDNVSVFIPALKIKELVEGLHANYVLDVENLKTELYSLVANYNINTTDCWLKLEKAGDGIDLTWGYADKISITSEKYQEAYELWKAATCSPEQACKKLGLDMETLMSLADVFSTLE